MSRASGGGLALLALSLWACDPRTTRPPFGPYPQASRVILDAPPARVIPAIAAWVAAESLRVETASPRDAYLETMWYDTRTRRSRGDDRDAADLGATVKLRCWADPWVPGTTELTVELVYRSAYDPSLAPREREVVVPPEHEAAKLVQRLVEAMGKRFGKGQRT
ncbi:MAG: hypothetical protein ACRDHF_09235 [Tepidiformaceae bacterium]